MNQRDAEHRQRVYDKLDRVEDHLVRVESRLAVVESKQGKIDQIADDVSAVKDAVIGIPEHPESGLVARMVEQERLESAEHGAIKAAIVGTPIVVGVVGLGLKVLGVV